MNDNLSIVGLMYSLSLLAIFSASLCYSYKFQKDFSNTSMPSKLFVGFITTIIIFSFSLFCLIISDIFTTGEKLGSEVFNLKEELNRDTLLINLTLSGVNVLCWLVLPFLFFYYYEENCLNNMHQFSYDDEECEKGSLVEENNMDDESNINSATSNIKVSALNFNLAKNYFYYLITLAGLNIIYLISYKISFYDSNRAISQMSLVPEGLRNISHFTSDFEILIYANFGVLITLAKFLFIIYVPYGAGKLTSNLVEKMKTAETANYEYSHLNNNLTKNYETIKTITSQKLMTGRLLSKKEKMILKSCKETETILQHKQEVLEDKYSNFQMFLFYAVLPFKFILILVSISFAMLFVTSKVLILYDGYVKSECGIFCAYLVNARDLGMTIQSLLYMSNNNYVQAAILTFTIVYLVSATVKGMSELGLLNITNCGSKCKFFTPTDEVRNSKTSTHLFYSVFLIITIASIFEVFSTVPNFSFFHNMQNCDIYLDSGDSSCQISKFGNFYVKFYLNFFTFKYLDILCSVMTIALLFSMILYYPIKSAAKDWQSRSEKLNS